MISGFRRPLSVLNRRIEERLTLIIDFYHLLLRHSSEAFDKQAVKSSTDAVDNTLVI